MGQVGYINPLAVGVKKSTHAIRGMNHRLSHWDNQQDIAIYLGFCENFMLIS